MFGVAAGLGLENKWNEVFFLVCLLAGLLVTKQRRILASKWFPIAFAVLLLLILPNLLWEAHRHWPTLELLHNNQINGKNVQADMDLELAPYESRVLVFSNGAAPAIPAMTREAISKPVSAAPTVRAGSVIGRPAWARSWKVYKWPSCKTPQLQFLDWNRPICGEL